MERNNLGLERINFLWKIESPVTTWGSVKPSSLHRICSISNSRFQPSYRHCNPLHRTVSYSASRCSVYLDDAIWLYRHVFYRIGSLGRSSIRSTFIFLHFIVSFRDNNHNPFLINVYYKLYNIYNLNMFHERRTSWIKYFKENFNILKSLSV